MPKRSLKHVGCSRRSTARRASPHSPRAAIRLFLLGEHAINHESLRLLFAAESDFCIVGSITHWADASRAHARQADVVVVDLSNPGMPDASALRALTRICASTHVIVMTPGFDRSQITEALRLGVRGIVATTISAELLFKCVRVVAAGQYWVARDIIVDLTQRLSGTTSSAVDAPRRNTFGLTGRELQVVSLLIAGHANKAIADRFGIRERTVRQHLTNMFDKVGVSNRLELALFALQQRLVVPVAAARRGGVPPR